MSEGSVLDGGNAGSGAGAAAGAGAAGSSGGGAGSASWRDSLPEDIRANPAISSFQDIPSLTKAFIETKSMVGKKGVIVPGEKATDQEWTDFYKSIGVPESDKYEIKLSEGTKVQENAMKWLKETAIKNGLLPKQAAALMEGFTQFEKTALQDQAQAKQTQQTQALGELKKEWGEAYNKECDTAFLGVKELGGDRLVNRLKELGLTNDSELIRAFNKAGKLLGEDKLREAGITDKSLSPGDIQSQITELRSNAQNNGLYDKSHPSHAATVAKMEGLYKTLTGGR